jgi:hypothetical protein
MSRSTKWAFPVAVVQTAVCGVRLEQRPLPFGIDAVDVTVVGNGGDLRRLVAERRDIFAALMELRPDNK